MRLRHKWLRSQERPETAWHDGGQVCLPTVNQQRYRGTQQEQQLHCLGKGLKEQAWWESLLDKAIEAELGHI